MVILSHYFETLRFLSHCLQTLLFQSDCLQNQVFYLGLQLATDPGIQSCDFDPSDYKPCNVYPFVILSHCLETLVILSHCLETLVILSHCLETLVILSHCLETLVILSHCLETLVILSHCLETLVILSHCLETLVFLSRRVGEGITGFVGLDDNEDNFFQKEINNSKRLLDLSIPKFNII